MTDPKTQDEYAPYPKLVFFPVGLFKLVLMCLVTLGFYELYWFYKNWKFIQKRTQADISPFWRAFFGYFFCYPCFKAIHKEAQAHETAFTTTPGFAAFLWIILTIAWKLPDPYWLVTYLAVLVLIPVQNTVNRMNLAVEPDHDPNTSFSGWNIFGLVLGGIVLALALLGALLPEP